MTRHQLILTTLTVAGLLSTVACTANTSDQANSESADYQTGPCTTSVVQELTCTLSGQPTEWRFSYSAYKTVQATNRSRCEFIGTVKEHVAVETRLRGTDGFQTVTPYVIEGGQVTDGNDGRTTVGSSLLGRSSDGKGIVAGPSAILVQFRGGNLTANVNGNHSTLVVTGPQGTFVTPADCTSH